MITTSEASRLIAEAMPRFDVEHVPYDQAAGRVLRQKVHAERDQPPFDRVTMDGIAIDFDHFEGGGRQFSVQGRQHAGEAVQTLGNKDACIEIMTGAVLPLGTNCVIPVERISVADGVATLEEGYEPKRNQFVHSQGSDHVKGHEVLSPGSLISPMDVAIIASCGLQQVEVSSLPTIRVISTGDELIPPGNSIEDHQIRMSNGPSVVAMLTRAGFSDCAHDHLLDEIVLLRRRLAQHLVEADVLLLSGGVSMGKADFVPQVLQELGVDVIFHKISQRPGLPMWFGMTPAGQSVFALPGNPVSTLVCCRQYVLPALRQALGQNPADDVLAVLAQDVTFKPMLTNFLPVKVHTSEAGVLQATPVPTNTSGDFSALSGTDGYVELERERTQFDAGTVVPFHPW